jgi:hypothetical protein
LSASGKMRERDTERRRRSRDTLGDH